MEFLVELDEKKSLEMISQCYSQKSALYFKSDTSASMIKAVVDSLSDKKVLLNIEPVDASVSLDTNVSMKFNIGTEVFFIKAPIKKFMNKYYFDLNSKVIQLKRRKEPRYQIPKKWSQSAFVMNLLPDIRLVNAVVHDISLSGIRLEVLNPMVSLTLEQIISIQFQIYKRSEISCDAIVRFCHKKDQQGVLVGLEFIRLKPIQQNKIASIVEDLMTYIATNKV